MFGFFLLSPGDFPFARGIIARIKTIPQFPTAGRIVPEYKDESLREKIYENCSIAYRIKR